MKFFKKLGAFAAIFTLITGTAPFGGITAFAADSVTSGGWYNAAFAEWTDNDPENAKVFYKLSGSEEDEYKEVDKELVRSIGNGKGRVDILGLAKGRYDIKITTGSNTTLKTYVKVADEDRSGYAHFNYNEGVGAYKNDGTPKDGAVILYVTNENKNSITYGKYTGIANILNHLTADMPPLIVRFIGTVDTTAWEVDTDKSVVNKPGGGTSTYVINETKGKPMGITKLLPNYKTDSKSASYTIGDTTNSGIRINGLNTKFSVYTGNSVTVNTLKNDGTDKIGATETTVAGSSDTSKTGYKVGKAVNGTDDEDTSLNMMDLKNASGSSYGFKNVTVEGVGTDTLIKNWGFNFINGTNVEAKNITFTSSPEDACSFTNCERGWLHRCIFNQGANRCDITWEKDKYEGDGSSDMNGDNYITVSYNRYNNTHKTSLNGGGDNTKQYNYTYHHNFYNMAASRLPLARYVNLHSYNNYVLGANTAISARASAWVFSEANYYENTNKVFETLTSSYGTGFIKSYNDFIVNSDYNKDNNIVIADKRNKQYTVNNSSHPDETKNFDTNSDVFYYDSEKQETNVTYLTDAETAKKDAEKAGVLTETPHVIYFGETEEAGDVDNNGAITGADATAIARHVENSQFITDEALRKKADFNGDGKIDNKDAKALAEFVARNTGLKAE